MGGSFKPMPNPVLIGVDMARPIRDGLTPDFDVFETPERVERGLLFIQQIMRLCWDRTESYTDRDLIKQLDALITHYVKTDKTAEEHIQVAHDASSLAYGFAAETDTVPHIVRMTAIQIAVCYNNSAYAGTYSLVAKAINSMRDLAFASKEEWDAFAMMLLT